MKIRNKPVIGMAPIPRSAQQGSALLTAVVFIAVGVIMLGSVLTWVTNHGRLCARKKEWCRTQYVAEAGSEKIFAAIRNYLATTGVAPGQPNLDDMATNQLPIAVDHPDFGGYLFVTPAGQINRIVVLTNGSASVAAITSGTYAGLNALTMPYRVLSRATSSGQAIQLTTGVQRDIEIQHIPLFQFAIFYNVDMEIENGPPMTVNGRVHSNHNAFFAPESALVFNDNVTVGLNAFPNPMPGDTHQTEWISPTYNNPITQGVPPLNLPIGSANPHDLIELPPASGTDPIASERLFNKAGLRIKVTDSGVSVQDGSGAAVTLPSGILTTSKTLFNYRENKTVALTEIDIGLLMANNKVPANRIVYIADTRTAPQQAAVRLVNGAALPSQGVTIASVNPVYIKGNFNSASDEPAAVFGDSVNILSANWNDAASSQPLSARLAADTTVNAAFFTGVVPTIPGFYSGGVENLPRFLENWTGRTFAYKGSMVVMFPSEIALGKWVYGGNYYTAPTRNWSFDLQFLDSTRLPPGTPSVRTIRRATWQIST